MEAINLFSLSGQDLTHNWLAYIFKIFFVIAALLYLFFTIVVIKQIKIMKRSLITSFSPTIKFMGAVHGLIALAVLIYYLLFL